MTDTATPRRTRTVQELLAELTSGVEHAFTDYAIFRVMHGHTGDYGVGLTGSFTTYEDAADQAARFNANYGPSTTYHTVERVTQGGRVVKLTPLP